MYETYKIRYNDEFEDFDVFINGVRKMTFSTVPHAIEFINAEVAVRKVLNRDYEHKVVYVV